MKCRYLEAGLEYEVYLEAGIGVGFHPALVRVIVVVGQARPGLVARTAH